MSRMGDEMILALAASLNKNLSKTAAKDKKEDKEDKKDKKEDKEDKEEDDKEDKKDKKEDKEDKKASVSYIVSGLYKLANDLDEMGEEEASSLVDDALRVIVQNIKDQ